MLSLDPDGSWFSEPPDLGMYNVIGTGPGLGMSDSTQQALKLLIQNSAVPLVIDADAINILSENRTWIPFLPKGSIFTPHPKEFERLTGKSANDYERNQRQRDFSVKHGVYVVLKGAHTAITTPDGLCFFNTTGNPGMATGGSGDVLTGIITGIRAQGYSSLESCILGVYLHGIAGDLASEKEGQESLIASDMIEYLGKSFISLYGRL
jgi:NAD(P)H-hydrate epimerase